MNGHPTYVNLSAFALTSLDLRGNFINDELICEQAFIFTKILWVIKYTINHEPIHEWASIFAKIIWVIKKTINRGPICECVFIFAQMVRVIKVTGYGMKINIHEVKEVLFLPHLC